LRDEFGQTFVIVTHNEEFNMADRKLVMVDGQISKAISTLAKTKPRSFILL
jgi:ABC-type proline/glycine betaine transport system ATPase subunit